MRFQRVRCCKTATFDNFCAISRATALEHHSANQFLKAATNLNFVQPKLFQASRQDDLRFSYCRVSVIQILDNADAAFRILGAGLPTVLSVTTMFADKPHCLNGRMCAAISCFDDLASGYRTRVGLPAQRAIAQRFRALARSGPRSEEHTSELQSQFHLVCRLLLEKKKHSDVRSASFAILFLLCRRALSAHCLTS